MKVYLITYGDENYIQSKEFLKETAESSDYFDHIILFSRHDIDEEFSAKVYNVLNEPKGGGFWIWKPYFIKKVLAQLEENDVLVYCDAGCMINVDGAIRFKKYLELLKESKTGTIDFELPHKEYEYTRQEVFDYLSIPDEIVNSNQLMATVILLRKCEHSVMLIDRWYDVAIKNYHLFDNTELVKQRPDFIAHRNDQSIFSVIRKKYGANIIPDETYFTDFIRFGQDYPIWATRLWG